MKIVLQPHLKLRLKQRQIPRTYPSKILSQPDSQYFDNDTMHSIAVKELEYGGNLRPMVVAYDIIDLETQIITVYPASYQEIDNRLKRRRCVKQT